MWKGYLALWSELSFTAFKVSLLKRRNSRDLRSDHKVSLFVESTSVPIIWPRTQFGFPWFSVCILISFLIGVYLPLSSTSSHKMTELKILGLCTWKTTNERRGGWSENRFPVLSWATVLYNCKSREGSKQPSNYIKCTTKSLGETYRRRSKIY